MKTVHQLYYSPYSNCLTIDYEPRDRKIICLDASCDLPDALVNTNGTITLQGYYDYPIKGVASVTGRFYWQVPVYDYQYNLYQRVERFLASGYREIWQETLTATEVKN